MSGASGKVPAAIHVTPEAVDGGVIAKIQTGDMMLVDGINGVLKVLVSDEELAKRQAATRDMTDSHWGMGREMFGGMRTGDHWCQNKVPVVCLTQRSNTMADIQFAIVADIGGTNARFSRVDLDSLHLDKVAVYPCADFDTLADALQFYRNEQGLTAIRHVALAIACPVTGDFVKMTNFRWQFFCKSNESRFGFSRVYRAKRFYRCGHELTCAKTNRAGTNW